MSAVVDTIEKYGGDPNSVVRLDANSADLLPYATLLAARAVGGELASLCAVYEWQQRPLLFVIDGELLPDGNASIGRIRRVLAMRGDAPYLAVVNAGVMTVYQIGLDADTPSRARLPKKSLPQSEAATIPHLGNLRPAVAKSRWISDVILKLLSDAIDTLIGHGIDDQEAISLVGRALFVRFLADRSLLPPSGVPDTQGGADALFDNRRNARATSDWLDETFNGDFLRLRKTTIAALDTDSLLQLGNILRRAPGGQLHLGWQERWDNLDFAHIPVGVLSQAYERYLSRHDPRKQKKEGGYYTPRHIADLMVRATLHPLRKQKMAHQARILDPASGAGVFLLTAFRELIAEKWRASGIRPDTKTLRETLYKQVTGFDINESALRFAALGLYLISIELDPNPKPVSKLKFRNLRATVLHWTGDPQCQQPQLGSLGNAVRSEHNHQFDVVVGNPPWASSTQLAEWSDILSRARETARARANIHDAPLPNEVLDLPFVWRAMEWAKPGAQIAFALHSRILFQQGENMPDARRALFRALDVTGIINGTELRNSKVWPEISAPFCLLFATNRTPRPGSGFRFTSPRLETRLNQAGAWRIDVANSEVVTSAQVQERPEILKILFRGTRLDLEAYDRLAASKFPSLAQYWRQTFGEERGRPRGTGNGYQRLRNSSRRRISGDGQPGADAGYLHGLPEFDPTAASGILVDSGALTAFAQKRIHDPRPRSLFTGPLLLVGEAPPVSHGRIRVYVSEGDVVFNQSYHGYTAAGHARAPQLIRYLALVLSSKLALWHALITSGRFGFEREVVEKFVLDRTPIVPIGSLTDQQLAASDALFRQIEKHSNDQSAWREVDSFIARLYRLDESDLETISDTLAYNLPFSTNRAAAESPASKKDVEAFADRVQLELADWADRFGKTISVQRVPTSPTAPWHFVRASTKSDADDAVALDEWMTFVRAADEMSATEIVYVDEQRKSLWLGRLAQRRYWSASQAKLAARRIIWRHVDFFEAAE